MAAGKHRAPNQSLQRVGGAVAIGALPVVLAVVGAGSAQADPVAPQSGPAVTAPGGTLDAQGAGDSQGTGGAQAQATAPSPSTFQIGDMQFNAPSWLDSGVVASVNQALTSMGMGHSQNGTTQNNGADQNGATQDNGAAQANGGTTTDGGTPAKSPAAAPVVPSVNH